MPFLNVFSSTKLDFVDESLIFGFDLKFGFWILVIYFLEFMFLRREERKENQQIMQIKNYFHAS